MNAHYFSLVASLIAEKPRILSNAEQIVITEGESLKLYCICVGHPEPTFKWRLPGGRVISSAAVLGGYSLSSNGTLSINKVNKDDHGECMCTCENQAGIDSISHHLAVQCKFSYSDFVKVEQREP